MGVPWLKSFRKILTYLFILAIAALSALCFELFIFPNSFAPSGLSGICTLIQEVFGIRVSVLNLVLNVPLAVAVYFKVSRPLALRSVVFTLGLSGFLMLFDNLPILKVLAYSTETGTSTLLGPVVAGLIAGFCYALLVRVGSYTGGLDFVAALIRVKNPEFNFFTVTFVLNCVVAGFSYFVYDYQIEPVLLCVINSYLASSVSDRILKSGRSAVKFEIVTTQPEELSQALMSRLRHTVTRINGHGMYSGKPVSVLVCIINRSQVAQLEELLRDFPGSFAYLSTVSQVMGLFHSFGKTGRLEKPLLDDGSDGTV